MALQSNGQEHHGSGPQARASDLGLLLGVVLPPLLAGGSDRAPPSAGSQAQEGRGSYSQQLHNSGAENYICRRRELAVDQRLVTGLCPGEGKGLSHAQALLGRLGGAGGTSQSLCSQEQTLIFHTTSTKSHGFSGYDQLATAVCPWGFSISKYWFLLLTPAVLP